MAKIKPETLKNELHDGRTVTIPSCLKWLRSINPSNAISKAEITNGPPIFLKFSYHVFPAFDSFTPHNYSIDFSAAIMQVTDGLIPSIIAPDSPVLNR